MAQAAEDDTVLIRNVRMIDRDGNTEDQIVNILIKDKKLHIVTKDTIPATEAALVVDANKGVLLGNLNVGQSSNFLILDQDPRDDFKILLDTNAHVSFAIHDGIIVRNGLLPVTGVEPETPAKKKPEWFAYTPPPIALPVSYQAGEKWNHWDTDWTTGGFVAGLFLDRLPLRSPQDECAWLSITRRQIECRFGD